MALWKKLTLDEKVSQFEALRDLNGDIKPQVSNSKNKPVVTIELAPGMRARGKSKGRYDKPSETDRKTKKSSLAKNR